MTAWLTVRNKVLLLGQEGTQGRSQGKGRRGQCPPGHRVALGEELRERVPLLCGHSAVGTSAAQTSALQVLQGTPVLLCPALPSLLSPNPGNGSLTLAWSCPRYTEG